jgi:hypothetical protein
MAGVPQVKQMPRAFFRSMWICWRDIGVPSALSNPAYLSRIFFRLQLLILVFIFSLSSKLQSVFILHHLLENASARVKYLQKSFIPSGGRDKPLQQQRQHEANRKDRRGGLRQIRHRQQIHQRYARQQSRDGPPYVGLFSSNGLQQCPDRPKD